MKLSIYGAGYVGLVSAACFAKMGHEVMCCDIDIHKIEMLKRGQCPIYEQDLPELLIEQYQAKRLFFTTSLTDAIAFAQIHVIATGTPCLPDGCADLSQIYAVAQQIAKKHQGETIVVTKSTVPVGTGEALLQFMKQECLQLARPCTIQVVANPEFLREGSALKDFLEPERIVIGGEDEALAQIAQLYAPLLEHAPLLEKMSRVSAELTKYAANAMLACRISFMNQISQIADKVGANIEEVRAGMARDTRIGQHFLNPGIGYGGSCFPKDVRALIQTALSLGVSSPLLQSIESINQTQKEVLLLAIKAHFGCLKAKRVGIWGLSFKPGTDDMRDASSLVIMAGLIQLGAKLWVHDPVAMPHAQGYFVDETGITWCHDACEVINAQLDALMIVTEWPIYRDYPLEKLKLSLKDAAIFDGRNCYGLDKVAQAGISHYVSIGRPTYTHTNDEQCYECD